MQKITLDTFIIANSDFETSQYQILNALKDYQKNLKDLKLYPVYSILRGLVEELENSLVRKACIKDCSPIRKIKFDFPQDQEVVEATKFVEEEMGKIWKLIEWGYDIITPIYDEACILHKFIENNIELIAIEDAENYEKSGCLLIPNNKMESLNFYKFSKLSNPYFEDNDRTVEANLIESINFTEIFEKDINDIGDKLISGYPELTNYPVYAIKTDLDLPFHESLLPVAKNLLASELTA